MPKPKPKEPHTVTDYDPWHWNGPAYARDYLNPREPVPARRVVFPPRGHGLSRVEIVARIRWAVPVPGVVIGHGVGLLGFGFRHRERRDDQKESSPSTPDARERCGGRKELTPRAPLMPRSAETGTILKSVDDRGALVVQPALELGLVDAYHAALVEGGRLQCRQIAGLDARVDGVFVKAQPRGNLSHCEQPIHSCSFLFLMYER